MQNKCNAVANTRKIKYAIHVDVDGLDEVKFTKIQHLIWAKKTLVKKVLETDDIQIEADGDTVMFSFERTKPSPEEMHAYVEFFEAICRQNRYRTSNESEAEVYNEKFYFSNFLKKLGFVREKYKTDGQVLLKNLSGDANVKGEPPVKEVKVVSIKYLF